MRAPVTLLAILIGALGVPNPPARGDAVSATIIPSTFEPFQPAYCVAFFQDGTALYYGIAHTPVRRAFTGRHDGRQLTRWLKILDDSGFVHPSPPPIPIDAGTVTVALRRNGVVSRSQWDDVSPPDWLQALVGEMRRAAEDVHWQPASRTPLDCQLKSP